ncbi:hypothetical protein WJX75_000903 [Coccomyxa subellipsoidea]|uniref:Acyltransferase n=1 Tax=Coccomyxa subellipsoidea TaxID=248742 RepID=A0ABR2Z2V8_9CHLO
MGMGGSGFSSTKAANSAVESADDLQKMHLHGSTIDTGFAGYIHNCSASVAYYSKGQTLRSEDIPCPRPNKWWEEAAALITMQLVFGSAWVLPPLWLACLIGALMYGSKLAAAFLAITVAAAGLPPGKRWEAFLHHWAWDTWRRYFRFRGIVPKPPFCDPGRHYIFAHFPHAVFPMGSWLSFPLCGDPLSGVPAPMIGLVATVLLQIPFFKHMFAWMGCKPADKPVTMRLLKNASVGIIVEGVAGIFQGATLQHERIFLKQRKGFIKCAIQSGVDIVPVYHLGSSQMLRCTGSSDWSRRMRMSMCVFWGRWGLPLPYKHDIVSLVGTPVTVVQQDDPSQEEVDAVHARFVTAITELFDTHKHLMPGWEKKKLTIV